ncbi:MAG: tRNA (adenosine(37)-N6)-threonylcarbamoyltransferase complex dimerization subunit type 1 TsaB [Clostridia bacterium]|nr:tRNA (adenosine(37)-N6)-threonylcarbamoyltransferase complex dimerization subunit type 1 TsaB [Clostridia bacterium]
MKILAVDCSAGPASAAIVEDGKILASSYSNVKLTHSQTLMPMIKQVLEHSLLNISELSAIAINAGPGSFTGVRIGISAVKGISAPLDIPCIPVSTLFSMAYNYIDNDCIVCAVMDARCKQVYNALFEIKNGKITRLCDDRAIFCENLAEEIKKVSQLKKECVIIVGDGSEIFYPYVKNIENVVLSQSGRRYQTAVSVAFAAEDEFNAGNKISSADLLPVYLRLPQAERELKRKNEENL